MVDMHFVCHQIKQFTFHIKPHLGPAEAEASQNKSENFFFSVYCSS